MNKWHNNNLVIYQEDFLKTHLKDEVIDLIITSPPYNVGIEYSQYKDSDSYPEYLEYSQKWFTQAYRILKKSGRMCLNIPLDKNKGGNKSVCADLTVIAQKVGFKYHSTIIWNEGNISRRTAWGSYMSASAPYVIAPVEVIVVLYKESWKKLNRGESDITKQEFMNWTNGLWTFNGESKKKIGHPAPFPIELPKRCIKLFSYVGDIVLDPFLGSGTTLIASHILKRKGVGIEIDPQYFDLSVQRVTRECHLNQVSFDDVLEKTESSFEEPALIHSL